MPYLDQAGLSAFWGKVKNWVASQSAKSMAKGTASTDGIPLTMSNGAATPVVLSTVKITKDDIAATGAKVTDTVYTHPKSAAGAKASGLYKIATDADGHVTEATAVAKEDITGLGIPGSDTKYTHPAGGAASKASGLYKFATDATSHVSSVTAVTKDDITKLGIPGSMPNVKKDPEGRVYSIDGGDIAAIYDYNGNNISSTYATKTEVSGKQDKIADLDDIRSGAKAGATALQKETDPTVPAWAKASTKPAYDATEIALGEASSSWFDDSGSVDDAIDHLMNKADTLETNINSLANNKAPLNSPTLTGTPKAPTAAAGTNTTQIATTAFVSTAVANAMTGAAKYKGAITPTSYAALKSYTQGWYWVVTTAGEIAGETCEIGDMVFCNATKSGLSAPAAADFDVVQNNITAIPDSVINGLS